MNSHLYTAAEDGVETPFSSLPGTVLDGGYEVQDLLRSEPHASVFRVRKLGDRYTQAEVTFFGLDERESAVQIECWRTAKNLSSPHLNAPLSFGTRTVGETMIPYVVLTKADETLAGVILERPLEAAEASEAMLNAARALVDLHTSGLIHGCVSPEHILSIGEDIKLSGHTARPAGTNSQTIPAKPAYLAPESSGRNSTPAADMWCLGACLVEAFTQKQCDDKSVGQLDSLPKPFAYIARRCLETEPSSRPTASEALDTLEGRIPVPAPAVAPLAAAATAASAIAPLPVIKPAPAPEPITKVSPPFISEPVKETPVAKLPLEQPRAESRPIWLYAGGGLVLVLLLWLAWPHHSVPAAAKQAAATQAGPQTSVPQHSAPAPAAAPVSGEQIWRVIVYAYRRQEDAQAMASSINQRHPGLDAKVFSPHGHSVSYLVTVGSPMTREEAARYRSRAIDSGMPRDSYIQNYRSE